MSEVPLGAFLSGGVDSSAMVGVMARESGTRVKTFAIGYEGRGSFQDERRYARIVAERFATEHREFVVSPDIEALFPELVATLGRGLEPPGLEAEQPPVAEPFEARHQVNRRRLSAGAAFIVLVCFISAPCHGDLPRCHGWSAR